MNQPKKNKNLLYDVGMHKGEDTDYYLKKGFKVVAFEANPDLLAHCKKRFSNEIEAGRLVIVEGAITQASLEWTHGKTVKFYKNKEETVWGTVASEWAQRNEMLGTSNEIIEVPLVNFAHCLEKYGIPYYLKIDIEGMDSVCLKSLLAFDQRPDFISIESEKKNYRKLAGELCLLTQLGYTEFKAVEQNKISQQVEPKPACEGSYAGYTFQAGSSGLFGKDLPGKWKTRSQISDEYKITFLLYKLFGDYGILKKFNPYFGDGRKGGKILKYIFGRTVPFWYDTHARHRSNVS